jgi:hypothetical protein
LELDKKEEADVKEEIKEEGISQGKRAIKLPARFA